MDDRIAKITSLAALVLLTACGGGGSGPAPGEAPLDTTATTKATTAPDAAAATDTTLTTTAAAASAKPKITPSMVRRVAAPPRPDNGTTLVQPGLPESPRRGDKAGNTQRSPTRVIDTLGTP